MTIFTCHYQYIIDPIQFSIFSSSIFYPFIDITTGSNGIQIGHISTIYANITDVEEVDYEGFNFPLKNWTVDFYYMKHVGAKLEKFYIEENNFSEVEKEILGLDHTQVGDKLARKWSFPESLCDIIRNHHRPEKAARYLELAHVVYLADLLMSRFHSGLELERLDTESLAARMETIGLSIDKFADIVDLIPIGVFESSPEMAILQ